MVSDPRSAAESLDSSDAPEDAARATARPPAPDADRRLDLERLARRFAQALAIPTISRADAAQRDRAAFEALHAYLRESFPSVHEALRWEKVGEHHALLLTWSGSDQEAEPWLLVSHQDVVGIAPGTEGDWSYPPFGGAVAEGFIWGRGAIDSKLSLLAALEAVEHLVAGGFQPRRTVYFALGADEEVGGALGGALIAAELRKRGVRLSFSLDEGGMVVTGAVPGVAKPVALIGTAEKGYATLKLTARSEGGHSAMPPSGDAATRVVRALDALGRNPMAAGLDGPTRDLLARLAPFARQPYRAVYRNLGLAAPLLLRLLARSPAGNAAIRSTIAATMIDAGTAENVIPAIAEATLNVRTRPGERVADAVTHVKRFAAKQDVDVSVITAHEASAISPSQGAAFQTLAEAITRTMPDAVPAPFLTLNGTDSRYFADIVEAQYRFIPIRVTPHDLERIHGVDERVAVEDYRDAVQFFIELIRVADAPAA